MNSLVPCYCECVSWIVRSFAPPFRSLVHPRVHSLVCSSVGSFVVHSSVSPPTRLLAQLYLIPFLPLDYYYHQSLLEIEQGWIDATNLSAISGISLATLRKSAAVQFSSTSSCSKRIFLLRIDVRLIIIFQTKFNFYQFVS